MHDARSDVPIGELLKTLSEETATLVRQEMQLARVELVEKGKQAGVGAGFLGGSTVLALGAFAALTVTLIAALALAMPLWAASLIVGIVYGIGAAILANNGKQKLQAAVPPVPQTAETLKEDAQWIKTHSTSAPR